MPPAPATKDRPTLGGFASGRGRLGLGRPQQRAEPHGDQQDPEGDIDGGFERVVGGKAGVANQDTNRADDDEDDRGAGGQGRSPRDRPFPGHEAGTR